MAFRGLKMLPLEAMEPFQFLVVGWLCFAPAPPLSGTGHGPASWHRRSWAPLANTTCVAVAFASLGWEQTVAIALEIMPGM